MAIMKKYIIITSIYPPTEAVIAFSKLENFKLIVIGDNKTPKDWHCENVDFIPIKMQDELEFSLAKSIPQNHYSRKMLGYLKAIQNNAEFIIDTDDDNIPKMNWNFPEFNADVIHDYIIDNLGFINVYQLYTDQKIWPRGLPLDLINRDFDLVNKIIKNERKVGIWQGLADEDPDVDAIYRLTSDEPCYFSERPPIVLGKNSISPFNTQNTIIVKELFPLLYLPTYVTFRYTDILRGLIAQPIMWLYNYHLGFTNATVIQKRNPHDYFKDFISEIPMYETCQKVVEIASNNISSSLSIENNLHNVYEALLTHKIVEKREMETLGDWLTDLNNFPK